MKEKLFDLVKSNLKNPKMYAFLLALLLASFLLFPYLESFAEKLLFYNCPHWKPTNYNYIKLTYFSSENKLLDYCLERRDSGVTIIELTPYTTKSTNMKKMPKLFSLSEDAHSVIGQEFDDVIVILNKYFTYKEDRDGEIVLATEYPGFYPYDVNHCVWEAISRTRKSLEVIVVENPELYNKISSILSQQIK